MTDKQRSHFCGHIFIIHVFIKNIMKIELEKDFFIVGIDEAGRGRWWAGLRGGGWDEN